MNMRISIRRIIAFFLGLFSRNAKCKCCGMPFWAAKEHITWLGPVGISALCEDCFSHLHYTERVSFYRQLRKVWGGSGSADEINWPLIREAIVAESQGD